MEIADKLRSMHALASDSCDPDFNKALIDAAKVIDRLAEKNAKLILELEKIANRNLLPYQYREIAWMAIDGPTGSD